MRATASANALQNRQYRRRSPGVFFLSSRASAPARGPGPILRSPSMGRRVWIPALAGMTCVCVCSSASNKRRRHPGQASDSEREPGSSNPDCATRTDRGYWIPAFAGMTGVSAGTRGDDGSVCGMIAVLCVACARMIGV